MHDFLIPQIINDHAHNMVSILLLIIYPNLVDWCEQLIAFPVPMFRDLP